MSWNKFVGTTILLYRLINPVDVINGCNHEVTSRHLLRPRLSCWPVIIIQTQRHLSGPPNMLQGAGALSLAQAACRERPAAAGSGLLE